MVKARPNAKPQTDVAKSASLLSLHRPGGLHRLMRSVASRTLAHQAVLRHPSQGLRPARDVRKAAGTLAVIVTDDTADTKINGQSSKIHSFADKFF